MTERTHEWFYDSGGARTGPVTLEQLRALLRNGEESEHTLCWKPGFGSKWKPLGELAEFQKDGSLIRLPVEETGNSSALSQSAVIRSPNEVDIDKVIKENSVTLVFIGSPYYMEFTVIALLLRTAQSLFGENNVYIVDPKTHRNWIESIDLNLAESTVSQKPNGLEQPAFVLFRGAQAFCSQSSIGLQSSPSDAAQLMRDAKFQLMKDAKTSLDTVANLIPVRNHSLSLLFGVVGLLILVYGFGAYLNFIELEHRTVLAAPLSQSAVVQSRSCRVSINQFASLYDGISYREAVRLLGCDGSEMIRLSTAGLTTVTYEWRGGGGVGANMTAMFQNDGLVMKVQFGLGN